MDKVPIPKRKTRKKIADVSLVDMMKWAQETRDQWMARQQEDKFRQQVWDSLEKRKTEVITKLLGFSARWGEWEVDHCNGRAGNSAAGDYLRMVAKREIERWMESLCWDDFDAELMKHLERAVAHELGENFQKSLRDKVREHTWDVLGAQIDKTVREAIRDAPYEIMKQLENI